MSTPALEFTSIPRPGPRSPVLAEVLSLVLPGLGHLHVGAVRGATALLALSVALPPALTLGWALGAVDLRAYWWADRLLGLALRVGSAALAALLAVRTRARPLPVVAPGVYGLFVIGAVLLGMLAGRQLQRWVPAPVQLSASGAGLEQGEYVQARRLGASAAPRVGVLALFVIDVPDAAVSPASSAMRDAYLARVSGAGERGFTVEGRDAQIPLDDYLGEPAGVVLSRGDGGVRWERLGFAPRRQSD